MSFYFPIVLLLASILMPQSFAASPPPGALFTYEGVLTDISGAAITTPQDVTLQILYPPSCVLLEETHTINPGSVGEFSVIVGSGLRADSTTNGAEKIFATSGSVTCMDGSTPIVTGTPRTLRVKVNSTTLSPDVTITNVPFAINASRLSDKAVTDFVQISANTTQSRVEDVFTRYTALDAALNIFSIAPGAGQLLGGNGGVYAPINLVGGAGINITHSLGSITIASTGGGGNVVAVTALPPLSVGGFASNPDITLSQAGVTTHGYLSSNDWNIFNNKLGTALSSGKIFVGSPGNVASAVNLSGDATLDNSGNLTLINVGTPGTYAKVTTDAKGRVTGGTTLTAADIPTLDWTKITGLPTTLVDYGITDAVKNGGNSSMMPVSVGTIDSYPLFFKTTGTTRMTISSDGRVGIGDGAPLTQLSVKSSSAEIATFTSTAPTGQGYITINNQISDNPVGLQLKKADLPRWNIIADAESVGTGSNLQIIRYSTSGTVIGAALTLERETGRVGINKPNPSNQLHVAITTGDPVAAFQNSAGTCTINPNSASLACSSDIRLKKDIERILGLDALDRILQLQAHSYRWRNGDSSRYIGFIAQDVQQIVPELVTKDDEGYLQVSYSGFVPLLSEAIKQVDHKVELQKRTVADETELLRQQVQALSEENRSLKKDLEMIKAKLGLQ